MTRRGRTTVGRTVGRTVAALGAALATSLWAGPAHGDTSRTLGSYSVATQAPVWQFTYDFPTASFHPQADGELTYATANMDTTRSHALSSVAWPGAAGGNLGSLVGVLGGPTVGALNDPARAEAFNNGGTAQQATSAPSGTTMSASVVPSAGAVQQADAVTTSGGLGLGQGGSLGSSSAKTTITLDQAGKLAANAVSDIDNIDIAGVFKAASLSSSVNEQSVGGSTPTGSSQLAVHNLTIAGQQAYVDGSGVHVGSPGQPPNPAINGVVNKALAGAGMQIYFTSPQQVTIASAAYNYGASLLITWVPPSNSHGDSFTFAFGGAAVAMQAGQGLASLNTATAAPTPAADAGPPAGLGNVTSLPPSPATPTLSLPSRPATAPASSGPAAPLTQLAAPASTTTAGSRGVAAGWFLLLGIAAVAGGVLTTRVPGLFTAGAAARCRDERPWSMTGRRT
jgi:hypothetical protein